MVECDDLNEGENERVIFEERGLHIYCPYLQGHAYDFGVGSLILY